MANMNSNGNGGPRNPDGILCECQTNLKSDYNAALSQAEGKKTLKDSKTEARRYKLCCLAKAELTRTTYRDIDNYVALTATKGTETIQKHIDDFIKKDAELAKMIKDDSKMLADLKLKIGEAYDSACMMKNCIKNALEIKDDKNTDADPLKNQVLQDLSVIMGKMAELNTDGRTVFDSVVTIAGIQTFTNTDGLKPFGVQLSDAVKVFQAAITGNIKTAEDDVKAAQTELTKVIEELNQISFEKDDADAKAAAWGATRKFICDGECDDTKSVDDFCNKISGTFDEHCPPTRPNNVKKGRQQDRY